MSDSTTVDTTTTGASSGPTFSRDQIHTFILALTIEMRSPSFVELVKEEMARSPVPKDEEEFLVRYEKVQAAFFTHRYHDSKLAKKRSADAAAAAAATDGEESATTPSTEEAKAAPAPLDGEEVLLRLRLAVKDFPDKETEMLILRLCVAQETQMEEITAAVPALKHLSRGPAAAAAAPAHGAAGAGSSHGHSHNGVPCHGHGHGHGHQHGGMQPFNITPEMQTMTAMAAQTLSAEQRALVERVQATMNAGSPPSPEDMRAMMGVQMQMMAFMQTMQQFNGGGGRGGGMPGQRGGGRRGGK